jgi:hypothetical protein
MPSESETKEVIMRSRPLFPHLVLLVLAATSFSCPREKAPATYAEARALAQQRHMPLLIDFYSHG